VSDLANGISNNVPSGALTGGEAWIILPTDPDNTADLLYPQVVVDASQATVQQATDIAATQTKYSPLDFVSSTKWGTNRRGTAVYQYGPEFADPNNENKVGKAYRISSESELLSEKKGILKCEATESRKNIGTDGPLCIVIELIFMKPLL